MNQPAPPARDENMAEPTLSEVLGMILAQNKEDRSHWIQLASQVSNQNVVLQAVQNEMNRLVSLGEKQQLYNEEQLRLTHLSAEHGRTFERAFKQIETEKSERILSNANIGNAIDKLSASVETLTQTASGYHGSLRTLAWVVGSTLPIGVILVSFVYSTLVDRIAAASSAQAAATLEVKEQHATDMAAALQERARLRDQIIELQKTKDLK